MLIAFGIFCCLGGIAMGVELITVKTKGSVTFQIAIHLIYLLAMVGCLGLAFAAFGGLNGGG